MYRQFNIQQFYVLPTQCICVFCMISEQTMIISLYSSNWPVFIIKTVCVYCAVRTGSFKPYRGSGSHSPPLSQWRRGFDPGPVHLKFVVDQVLLPVLRCSPCQCYSINAPYSSPLARRRNRHSLRFTQKATFFPKERQRGYKKCYRKCAQRIHLYSGAVFPSPIRYFTVCGLRIRAGFRRCIPIFMLGAQTLGLTNRFSR